VMVMKLTSELEKVFGSLTKTLFFEYQNIGDLAKYFIDTHFDKLHKLIGPSKQLKGKISTPRKTDLKKEAAIVPIFVKDRPKIATRPVGDDDQAHRPVEIAIVGLAGSYPQARTLDDFWENLCKGKNCVTEIPSTRWDYKAYYDADKNKPGKTY